MEWVFWLVMFAVAITFQLQAVARGSRWGMLTSSVRWLRVRIWGRLVLFPAWFWLTWHWFLEPRALGRSWWDDALAVLAGVAVAVAVDYHDYFKSPRQDSNPRPSD